MARADLEFAAKYIDGRNGAEKTTSHHTTSHHTTSVTQSHKIFCAKKKEERVIDI